MLGKRWASSRPEAAGPSLSIRHGRQSQGTGEQALELIPAQRRPIVHCLLIRVEVVRDRLETGTELFGLPEKHSIPNANLSRKRTEYRG